MEHYVTLFDSAFLPQGVALQASLERHAAPYTLWVLCVDNTTHDVLTRLGLANTRLLKLGDVETADLLRVKPGRSRVEYCWTLTPFTPRFVFEADAGIGRVTYVDADLWFRRHPGPIFAELDRSAKEVLITDHAYAPKHDQASTSGRYCVQFMIFNRRGSDPVRTWWEERCIEWCFARYEDGRFGDQKYVDDWPERFSGVVHVLQNTRWARAPWNGTALPYDEALFYHFHGLRLLGGNRVNLGGYPLTRGLIRDIYAPYLNSLARAVRALRSVGFEPRAQQKDDLFLALKRALFSVFPRRRRFVVRTLEAS